LIYFILAILWPFLILFFSLFFISTESKYYAFPYAFQISLGLTLAYLVIMGVFSSRQN
jgi:hypothetical protein